MNFLDLLNPMALVDPKGKYTPNLNALGNDMFSRGPDQTGTGKPALQSFTRNLGDMMMGTEMNDKVNQSMLGDMPADPNYEQNELRRQKQAQPAVLSFDQSQQDPMQQMLTMFMQQGGR